MSDCCDRIETLSPRRRRTVDYMRTAGRRSNVHGLVAVDVTEARERIQAIETETGERFFVTATIVCCLARAIEDHPRLDPFRDWRGHVHVFEEVDVNMPTPLSRLPPRRSTLNNRPTDICVSELVRHVWYDMTKIRTRT